MPNTGSDMRREGQSVKGPIQSNISNTEEGRRRGDRYMGLIILQTQALSLTRLSQFLHTSAAIKKFLGLVSLLG